MQPVQDTELGVGTETYAKEAVTTLGGTRVLPLKLSDGSTEYVTDTPTPEFVKAFAPKGSKAGPATSASRSTPPSR